MIYDGYDFSHLMRVETPVGRSLLAEMAVDTESMGRDGEVYKSASLSALTLDVPVRIIAGQRDLCGQRIAFETMRRMIAGKLYRTKPCKLVLDDAPDVYYMAMLTGSTDLDRFVWTGGTTLTFISPKPWAYGSTHTKRSDGGSVQCNVSGTFRTCPVVTVETQGSTVTVLFDGAAFNVSGTVTSADPVVIDATEDEHTATKGGAPLKVDIMCDFPEWEPGLHTVQCSEPFTVEWVDRWL